jgi:hypothetical protein
MPPVVNALPAFYEPPVLAVVRSHISDGLGKAHPMRGNEDLLGVELAVLQQNSHNLWNSSNGLEAIGQGKSGPIASLWNGLDSAFAQACHWHRESWPRGESLRLAALERFHFTVGYHPASAGSRQSRPRLSGVSLLVDTNIV